MNIVDSHVHLWDLDLHDHAWLRAAGEPELQHSFRLADFTAAATDAPRAVLVQAGRSAAETVWLLELAAASDRIAGVVVYGDLTDSTTLDWIDRLRAADRAHTLVGLRDPVPAGGGDRLRSAQAYGTLRGLAERGLAVDLLLAAGTLPDACEVARDLPQVRFVLNHVAINADVVRGRGLREWREQLAALGNLPNVTCKLSGLGKATAGPAGVRLADVAAIALDAFGPERLMFGSDWPVCTQWSGYPAIIAGLSAALARLTPQEAAAVWGGTAHAAYGLRHGTAAIDRIGRDVSSGNAEDQ